MSITESRIKAIEDRLDELTQNFLQTQRNQVPITQKTDNNANQIVALDNSMNDLRSEIFQEWDGNGVQYFAGERDMFENELYKCIQDHKSQPDWTPDKAVSLWVKVADPSEEYPEWVQPTGAQDAYMKGDKVSHNEKHWTSDVDSNVWEPGVYGWREV